MAQVISGFPGIGKSYFCRTNIKQTVLDSDSSKFSWSSPGERNPEFPKNYMRHILRKQDEADIILVSSHKVVRDALVKEGIWFTLVYPDRSAKEGYLLRYKDRGSDANFLALLDANWDEWISELEAQSSCSKIVMKGHQFLSDVLPLP